MSNIDQSKSASRHGDLTTGNLTSHLIRLSGPMTWGILMVVGFQLVDTYFVSLLGGEKLAAFTFTFPVTYFIFSFIMGFSIATSSVISRLIGENAQDIVRRVVSHAIILVIIASLILTALGLAGHDAIFSLLGASPDMMPMISNYMTLWFWGAVFVSAPMVANAAMRAAGDAMTPALIMTAAMVVNIVLDPIMIFGLFGFPRMELAGAALATVIANAGAFIMGAYVLYRQKKILCPKACVSFHGFKDSAKRILTIALPVGVTNTVQPIVNSLIIALLAKTSIDAVTAFGIATRIEAFAFVILMGLAVGMGPILGQNFGSGKFDRVHGTVKKAINFNLIWSALIAVILALLASPIAKLFSDDPAVIEYSVLFFLAVPVSYAFSNLLGGWASTFNALGKPQKSFMMIAVKFIVLLIPALYIGYHLDDVRGVFIAISAINIITGIAFHFYSRNELKKLTA